MAETKVNTNQVNASALRVARTTTQSIANNTNTKIQYGTTTFDSRSEWDGTNFRFVAKVAGYYRVTVHHRFQAAITADVRLGIYKNGSVVAEKSKGENGDYDTFEVNDTVSLAVGDYIECFVMQLSGSSQTIDSNDSQSYMSISSV